MAARRKALDVLRREGQRTQRERGAELVRADLCVEAIRLGRLLVALLPGQPTAKGLHSLLLLTDARRPARTDCSGKLVPLDEQDRSRWNR